ncbi:lipoprotein, putative [Roseibacterium elongatum DSM 19469]|uniref:Lipoprotein, putative n=1 Tax=Roseicyclus elongatus DSM 19469 TaxID=1294273 RepID=W8RSD8_9RHOB|nr:lipoprotein, putative [Roseibacterium elongatum DSM 19469]
MDAGSLSQLEAGIWIDPDGCHHWMIDDGLEGYWDLRRDPVSGLPVCTNVAPPNSIVGDISRNPGIPDFTPGF